MSEYTSNAKRFCSVFKSSKKKEMYLYVDRKYDLKELPEVLTHAFGTPLHVMDMILTPEKKLARVSSLDVLASISDKGFFLQMPPVVGDDVAGEIVVPKDSLHG